MKITDNEGFKIFNFRSQIDFFLRILLEVICKLNCVVARNSCWFTMATLSDGIDSQMMLRIIRESEKGPENKWKK